MAENRATKRLKSCDTEGRAASKSSRTQDDKEEQNIQFPATKLQGLQQQQEQPAGPYFDPDSGVGSSSTSTYEDGASSSSSNKFDVFISHRGPDTKQTLAYHMYDLLQVHGIPVFLDKEELERGERFAPAIDEAIACSKVHVCILSTGYARSFWCLKELEMMVRKYDMAQSKLIPVFYDVHPSDVRHLKGEFGQGFQKLKTRYSSEVTDTWEKALRTIADITGYEGKGECCKNIVNKILEELDIKLLDVPTNMIGREEALLSTKDAIMRCRQNGCGVTSVEISGIGGIGKTTFAKELYNQFCSQYERSCFIENVKGLVESHGINEVHKQLIIQLFKYNQSHLTKQGTQLLRERLHNAEVLVVLDNIDSKIQLSMVFIEDHVSLNPRSIIIVTSREEGVLKHDSKIAKFCKNLISLDMLKLDFSTSKKLFCQYAFGGIENVENKFNELIEKIVKKCDGIPLALTLLGRQVYGTDIKFWKNLWNTIEDSLHGDLKKILQLSYDNLDLELQKCLFLDVATFFLGEKQELLVQLRGRDKNGESEVLCALEILKRKLLIQTFSNGFLNMHVLLVDLGRSIVKDEDPCPGYRSRVWRPSDVRYVLSEEMGTEKIKALSLVSNGSAVVDDGCQWSGEAFNKLSSLEFLILDGHCIEEGSDFSKFSKKLLWLKWTNFPYDHIPETLCIKRVRILELSGDRLTRLWECRPQEAPTKLRRLSLSNCKNLQSLPEFTGHFLHLSSMILFDCTSLKTISESFGELQGLMHLQLQNCKALVQLPEGFGKLQGLKRLQLQNCRALVRLPEGFGDLQSLCSLEMKSLKRLKSLPESFGKMLQLENLIIWGCYCLEHLPESFGKLSRLKILYIIYGKALQRLPDSFGNLAQLKKLHLKSCKALQGLPDSFGNLSQLRELYLMNCKALQRIPNSFGNLAQLKELYLVNCKALQGLPDSFRNPAQLEKLHFMNCKALQGLPDSFGNVAQLKELYLMNCKALPDFFGNLAQLKKLYLKSCKALQGLPDSFGNLSQFKELYLMNCKALQGLPDFFGNLAQLKELYLMNCKALQGLPDSFRNLELELLDLLQWKAQQGLPNSFGNLAS